MPIKISLIKGNCKRCGKELVMTNRSLWGLDEQKKEFGVLCHACEKPEDHHILNESIGKTIHKVCGFRG